MVIILLIIVLLFSALVYAINKKDKKKLDEKEKGLTDSSIQLLAYTFFSIIISVIISLQADISDSSGHGGFIYIIIPVFAGVVIMFFYLISLLIIPRKKILLGVISIFLNIITGVVCSGTDF